MSLEGDDVKVFHAAYGGAPGVAGLGWGGARLSEQVLRSRGCASFVLLLQLFCLPI